MSNLCKFTCRVRQPASFIGSNNIKICSRQITQAKKARQLFNVIDGQVDSTSSVFAENTAHNEELQQKYNMFMGLVEAGGGEKASLRHTERNRKFLVKDRLMMLFDDADDVLSIGSFAGLGMKYGNVPRAGMVIGVYM